MQERSRLAAVGIALSIGFVGGFFVSRGTLAAQWARGPRAVDQRRHDRSSSGDANPTPAVGTKVFAAMPIGRMRNELSTWTAHDPLTVSVAAVGAGEDGYELHVVVENRGSCDAIAYAGVAYGFDAHGSPAPLNRDGEQYVAFRKERGAGKALAVGSRETYAQRLLHCDVAALAVAHVDEMTCADGTSWRR